MVARETNPYVATQVIERGLYTDVIARLEMPVATARIMNYLIDDGDGMLDSHIEYATDNAVRLIWNSLYYEYYEFLREIQSLVLLHGNHQLRARYDVILKQMSFREWKGRVTQVEEDSSASGENSDFVSESEYF